MLLLIMSSIALIIDLVLIIKTGLEKKTFLFFIFTIPLLALMLIFVISLRAVITG